VWEPPRTEGLSPQYTEMVVDQRTLQDLRIPLEYRDFCAEFVVPYAICARKHGYGMKLNKGSCHHYAHEWERCMYHWHHERLMLKSKWLKAKTQFERTKFANKTEKKTIIHIHTYAHSQTRIYISASTQSYSFAQSSHSHITLARYTVPPFPHKLCTYKSKPLPEHTHTVSILYLLLLYIYCVCFCLCMYFLFCFWMNGVSVLC